MGDKAGYMEIDEKVNRELLEFLDSSPTSFHAVANMKAMLEQAGFKRLLEGQAWTLEGGAGYYVTRNDSALIAFRIPDREFTGFQIMASHSDSPALKIKDNAEIEVEKRYVKLNVERYGGLLCAPLDGPPPCRWRGRVVVRTGNGGGHKAGECGQGSADHPGPGHPYEP